MPEVILTIVKYGVVASVFVSMFGLGLNIAPRDLRFSLDHPGLMIRSLVVVVVLVPLAVVAIDLFLQPAKPVAVALAVLAASPAAPLAMGKAQGSGGALVYAANLQLLVAFLAPITTPLTLTILERVLDFEVTVNPLHVAQQVLVMQFLPIGLGVLVRAKLPRLEQWGRRLVKVANLVLLATIAIVLAFLYGAFLDLDWLSYLAIVAMPVAALSIGHLSAPRGSEMRVSLALEAAMRNPGLALLIGNLNFPEAHPLQVLTPCIVVAILFATAYGKWQLRKASWARTMQS
jgi:BASS family bile acid:Na+ symporter